MATRTVRDFEYQGDVWEIVKAWALAKGFDLQEKTRDGKRKVYQKKISIAGEKFFVIFDFDGKNIHLEAYFKDTVFGERPIDSGIGAILTKKKCRDLLRELMLIFDQPPI